MGIFPVRIACMALTEAYDGVGVVKAGSGNSQSSLIGGRRLLATYFVAMTKGTSYINNRFE